MSKESDLIELADGLHSAAVRLIRRVRAEDRKSGLSPARLSALSVLAFSGPVTVGRLAQLEGVRSPTMTGILNGLVAEGLVERRNAPGDQRAVQVTITAKGRRLFNEARRRRVEAVAGLLEGLPENERAVLGRSIRTLRTLIDG